jgi:DNA replication protein DnaC
MLLHFSYVPVEALGATLFFVAVVGYHLQKKEIAIWLSQFPYLEMEKALGFKNTKRKRTRVSKKMMMMMIPGRVLPPDDGHPLP